MQHTVKASNHARPLPCAAGGVGALAALLLALGSVVAVSGASARDRGADGNYEKRTSSHFVLYQDVDIDRSSGLRGSRAFEQRVLARISGTSVHGGGVTRSWDVSNIAFDRLEAEPLLLGFSERGLYASAGAACSSGSVEPSPVLLAMHVPPERAVGSIRFSVGRDTTAELIDQAIEIVSVVVERLRIDQ